MSEAPMNDLRNQLKRYYSSQSLPDERVDAIVALGQEIAPLYRRGRSRFATASVAALVIVVLSAVALFSPGNPTDRVVREVALNHLKHKTVDFTGNGYEEVQAQMSALSYSIVPPAWFRGMDYELVGGRYCHLMERKVAQLKVRDRKTGVISTLYVAPLVGNLVTAEAGTRRASGVEVQTWIEDHRLFALATDVPRDAGW